MACRATARSCMVKRMAPSDSMCQIGTVRDSQAWLTVVVAYQRRCRPHPSAFSISQFRYILGSRATARSPTAEWMLPLDSTCQNRSSTPFQLLADCSGGISEVMPTPPAGFRISEFRYILCSRATARHRRPEWMARADSACQIGLVRYSQCWLTVVVASQRWRLSLVRPSQFRNLGMFLPASPQRQVVWQNGWYQRILRVTLA